ncbi:MAG: right-handed parallel beta-helix repeat-containing protein [Dehalococcoidia bacterium]
MKRIFGILFALLLVVSLGLVTAAPVLAGTTVHVPGDYATIQEAIDAAGSGDTIMVAAGDYHAFVVEGKPNINIISTEGATVTTANLITPLPVVGNAWVMAAVYESQNVNIEGISFDGTGGSGKPVAVGIAYVDSTGRIADLTVENVIATSLGAGVAIIGDVGSSTVEMTGATICSNDNAGIYVCGGSTLEAHLNKIVDNAECGLLNDGGETVDATGNWWGHKSGPLHQTNPLGRGNAVSGDVHFKPWLEAEVVTERVDNGILAVADTEVEVDGRATVTIARYSSNPHPTLSGYAAAASLDLADLDTFRELDMFRDVRVTDAESGTEIEIRLYYTDAEARGFNETSLRLFWWNNTTAAWVQCSPDAASGVDTTDITIDNRDYSGYMWAKITEDTTPSLTDDMGGTPWGGYGHPKEVEGPCFVATAAYGTETAKELDILREFRDGVLLPDSLGAKFVSLYYKTSPPIADFISQHEILRTAVRVGLVNPIVAILDWSHDLWSARNLQ